MLLGVLFFIEMGNLLFYFFIVKFYKKSFDVKVRRGEWKGFFFIFLWRVREIRGLEFLGFIVVV